jgi:hypothetical protein
MLRVRASPEDASAAVDDGGRESGAAAVDADAADVAESDEFRDFGADQVGGSSFRPTSSRMRDGVDKPRCLLVGVPRRAGAGARELPDAIRPCAEIEAADA